jgi:hypothetical protein
LVIEDARSLNARLIRWQVLPDNQPAKNFYRQHGAALDADWENWFIDLAAPSGTVADESGN